MRLTLPIYIQEHGSGLDRTYVLRPLFADSDTEVSHTDLRRGLLTLQRQIKKELMESAKEPRPQSLALWSFFPDWKEERILVRVALGKSVTQTRALAIQWREKERSVAMLPAYPDLWFDPLDDIASRAGETLSRYLRAVGELPTALEEVAESRESITTIEIEFTPPADLPKEASPFAVFGGQNEELSGFEQLEKVGRRLDSLYPDGLTRALLREREAEELFRLLYGTERRAVLLVGPPKAGKSAIIHEMVYRARQRQRRRFASKRSVWLIAPQRLISGMSYVGQWEARLLAIVEAAKSDRHILYFDDLLGLLNAGRSAQTDLNVAMVLRPFLERREVRIVGEITPQALRVLRERDRAFADLFHLMPVHEKGEVETLRILCAASQAIEVSGSHTIDPLVLPAVLTICRRFLPETVLPGKAVELLRNISASIPELESPTQVWSAFARQKGLGQGFARHCGYPNVDFSEALSYRVIGQRSAVERVGSHLLLAGTNLRDPHRPVGVFLFVGPTGVGKTETAKALSLLLFDTPDRLLRFDMNEFCGSDAVARLAGTFHQPEGLLTSAIRQQPMCVLLLDEIEKADPGVFDLLLQLLGEGRLTDALGRTADFTNAVIVMTSNLGVREDLNRVGFGREDSAENEQRYLSAVRRFFRPEFFNRIDSVVPFHPLGEEEILAIARLQLDRLLKRHGFAQRRCWFQFDTAAQKLIAERGYDSKMGARALKRAIERLLTQPLARLLAQRTDDAPVLIAARAVDGQLKLKAADFRLAPALKQPAEAAEELIEEFIERISIAMEPLRPSGAISLANPPREAVFFYALKEKLGWIERQLRRVFRPQQRGISHRPPMGNINRQSQNPLRKLFFTEARMGQMIRDQFSMRAYLDLIHEPASSHAQVTGVDELAGECAVVLSMLGAAGEMQEERYLVILREPSPSYMRSEVADSIVQSFNLVPGAKVDLLDPLDIFSLERRWTHHDGMSWSAILVAGVGLGPALGTLRGLTLREVPGEPLQCLQCDVIPNPPDDLDASQIEEIHPLLTLLEDAEVTRVASKEGLLDLRTGILSASLGDAAATYKILGATLLNSYGA